MAENKNRQGDFDVHPVVRELDHHLSVLQVERRIAEVFLGFLLLVATVTVAYLGFTRNHVGANVKLAGEDISFKSRAEVAQVVDSKINDFELTLRLPDKSATVGAEELGIEFDRDKTVAAVFEQANSSNVEQTKKKFADAYKGMEFPLLYDLNQEDHELFLDIFSTENSHLPINASVEYKDSGFRVVNSKPGVDVEKEQLSNEIKYSATSGLNELTVPAETKPASVSDETAAEAVAKGEEFIRRKVIFRVDATVYEPSREDVAAWVDFKPELDKLVVYIDRANVGMYLNNTIASKHNDAYREINTDTATADISSALESGKDIDMAVPFISKNSRPPQPWMKYVEINLSKQWFYAIYNGRVEMESGISSGRRANATPAGILTINRRLRMRDMVGGDPPNTFILHVPHVQYFTNRGHAIHGTYWHNEFGYRSYRGAYGRSHGCINLPLAKAAEFWEWNKDLGLPVWIHY